MNRPALPNMSAHKIHFSLSTERRVCLVFLPAMGCLGMPLAHADSSAPAGGDIRAWRGAMSGKSQGAGLDVPEPIHVHGVCAIDVTEKSARPIAAE
jgi:hypothetical protein